MSRLSLTETRAVQRGETIARQYVSKETGEAYWCDVKFSWGKLYYSCGNGWHTTPKTARLAREEAASGPTIVRTRRSIGTQLRDAFNDMKFHGTIKDWGIAENSAGPLNYWVAFGNTCSLPMAPGRAMEFANEYGYDVRFGKA